MQRFSFLLMMVLAFSFIDLVSQDNPKSRERIETAKKVKLLEILDLNESESEKFLVKYNSAEKLVKEKNELFHKYTQELMQLLDDKASTKELSDKSAAVINAQKELHSAVENKISSMKSILSEQNFAKFLVFDMQFNQRLRKMLFERGGEEFPPDSKKFKKFRKNNRD